MRHSLTELLQIIACPVCHNSPLVISSPEAYLICESCGEQYEIKDGIPIMVTPSIRARFIDSDRESQNELLQRLKNHPLVKRLLRLSNPPTPVLNTGAPRSFAHLKQQLLEKEQEPMLLVIGSGDKNGRGMHLLGEDLLQSCINLEIAPLDIVDIVGVGEQLPLQARTFDAVVIQAVLEHVRYPREVVSEIQRVLKPGGFVYAEIPFLQAFHAGPGDYRRFTIQGIKVLFEDFEPVLARVCAGPTSTLMNIVINYLALALSFGNLLVFKLFFRIFGWLLFPFKYLDFLLVRSPIAHILASGVSFLGRKEDNSAANRH